MTSFQILPVIENRVVGPYTLLRVEDKKMHSIAKCGHFIMVGLPNSMDPFLLRPISFLSVDEKSFTILIKVKGKGTEKLSKVKEGESLKILGPLGKALEPPENGILIAGGIGIAPLYYQSEWMKSGVLFYGAKREKDLVFKEEIKDRGFIVNTISEEKRGTVVDLISENLNFLKGKKTFVCGPESMIKELKGIIGDYAKDTFVYIERRMGCGLGGCKSCAVKVYFEYKLVCQDGPIFPLHEVKFD